MSEKERGRWRRRERGWDERAAAAAAAATKHCSPAHVLLCILLFWLANIQHGRLVIRRSFSLTCSPLSLCENVCAEREGSERERERGNGCI